MPTNRNAWERMSREKISGMMGDASRKNGSEAFALAPTPRDRESQCAGVS